MNTVDIWDFLKVGVPPVENRLLVNVRGCNGAGKSTIPLSIWSSDPDTFELVGYNMKVNKFRSIATVSPKHKFIAVGHYHTQCGGMDTLSSTQNIKDIVELLWDTGYHLLMEGIVSSTVRGTYIDLFNEMNQEHQHRGIVIYNLVPPLETCIQRIKLRNGDKEIKEEMVRKKWDIVAKNVPHFANAGFVSLSMDNTDIPKEQTLDWFLGVLKAHSKMACDAVTNKSKPAVKGTIPALRTVVDNPTTKYYIEPEDNLKQYDWYPDYQVPNDELDIDQKYYDQYWYFIAERMNIWYKRVVLGNSAPWTDDPILQTFKFTNAIRDLDRLSIYERKHILERIDDIQDDWSEERILKWKQSILLNIMMFRLWVKVDTWEIHGFIDLTDSNWRTKWDAVKAILLQRREDGVANFTAAYWVSDLKAANPDPATKKNKTASAIAMIEGWMDNIDDIYNRTIVQAQNMTDQMKEFRTLPCVGEFTSYEYACSITEITRYCKHHLIEWTQDNATNVGPGAQRGINWIFKNKGGLSDYQCILYLRSIWKHEMKKRGTYNRFINQLPKEMKGDIDLRVIEHCLCECQKYNKAWTNTGRPKETFRPKDIEELRAYAVGN